MCNCLLHINFVEGVVDTYYNYYPLVYTYVHLCIINSLKVTLRLNSLVQYCIVMMEHFQRQGKTLMFKRIGTC